jgi:glycosyltransferase involved in cell wall biosynthesis/peptidoglycan/xylan/chitin deacetylase (PgdA/CDA1 family)
MLLNRIYYFLKPILPWRLRVAMRQRRAASRRIAYAGVWPIDENAGKTPPGWPGWPNGARFAFVLTHDVEGNKGIARVEELMKLEQKHVFRSSFNFVPEREYRLPDALRHTLQGAGFEVGVHGLKHDGKLYASKTQFASRAARIREYLKNWDARGFRSPLMQHKLQWLHLLGAEYDASTFDTDPFEPEPDGAGTIFPFWVPGPNGTGFVELPYSLPQDFTMFSVLNEPNIDIWKRKLDWVAERGGMALLNTHPDYMCFQGAAARDEFPVSFYEELLRYARERYAGAFWHATPQEVSEYYRAAVPASARNSRKKICMVAYTDYESDNRVRRYAESLVKRGDQVDVIALSCGNMPLGKEEISGVNVYRIQRRDFDERSKWTYARRLVRFLVASSRLLMRRHKEVRYDLIHVHNVPDFLVFSAWYPKWTGAKVILDIHDIVPELFASKFGTDTENRYVKALKWIEKVSVRFADHVIVSNHLWQEKLAERSAPPEKCSVYVNHVDPAIFYRRNRTRDDGKFIMIFPGSFQWHQGLDIAIEALGHIKDRIPQAELHLYGGGSPELEADLLRQVERLGLNGRVTFCSGVPFERIAETIANADLGVVPKRADSFGNEAYSTKIMEFMSQGIPALVSRTKIDTFYFDETVVRFFQSGDSRAMADAIVEIFETPALRSSLVAKGFEYVDQNSWDRKKQDYLKLVDTLTTEVFAGSEAAVSADVQPAKAKPSL